MCTPLASGLCDCAQMLPLKVRAACGAVRSSDARLAGHLVRAVLVADRMEPRTLMVFRAATDQDIISARSERAVAAGPNLSVPTGELLFGLHPSLGHSVTSEGYLSKVPVPIALGGGGNPSKRRVASVLVSEHEHL